jgi:hypothetical protein
LCRLIFSVSHEKIPQRFLSAMFIVALHIVDTRPGVAVQECKLSAFIHNQQNSNRISLEDRLLFFLVSDCVEFLEYIM